ncbi:hypothetical protein Acr_07g0014450 [Actinidia rufa]|uniref:Uncharacterized protein n=1 Tax=Actinidia rufa TaxID=165716 RepID=A0A7J0EZ56_9ERIC|nr:hypothetical protein Acr_07g0014450 [Actinidia rufa]
MPKNINTEVEEQNIDNAFDMKETKNSLYLRNMGRPVLSSLLPGTVKAVVNMTAEMWVHTTMPEAAVFFIHLSPSFAKLSGK